MELLNTAREFANLNKIEDAKKIYTIILNENNQNSDTIFEASIYLLKNNGDYKLAFNHLKNLYNDGKNQKEIYDILYTKFYAPNAKNFEKQYKKTTKILAKYKYCFKKDFLPFNDLAIQFFKIDEQWLTPFYINENKFGDYIPQNSTIMDRYFFKDLENPVFATDVYRQFELEYLNDNVRKSEWVAKENHIYLHYSNFNTYCSYLQHLDFQQLVKDEKIIILIEDEKSLYPIDFKEKFGIDYSTYPVKFFCVKEITRLIWHTQLSSHNGGDFFNEIFDGHPNLLATDSLILDDTLKTISDIKNAWKHKSSLSLSMNSSIDPTNDISIPQPIMCYLWFIENLTETDILIAMLIANNTNNKDLDLTSRISPAIFFQPHFKNANYTIDKMEDNSILSSDEYDEIRNAHIFDGFKYIKTFTPMRRITTSYSACIKFMYEGSIKTFNAQIPDELINRVQNKSYMIDIHDRLFENSILVRFEDGKLNPKATFTALAEFLDIPYTNSMTYCSLRGEVDPEAMPGNVRGFNTATVYRKYDDFANDSERAFIEYFSKDAMKYYGYNFNYYDGKTMNETDVLEMLNTFTTLDNYINNSYLKALKKLEEYKKIIQKIVNEGNTNDGSVPKINSKGELRIDVFKKIDDDLKNKNLDEIMLDEETQKSIDEKIKENYKQIQENRINVVKTLIENPVLFNKNGSFLQMQPKLKLNPDLLENPLYH